MKEVCNICKCVMFLLFLFSKKEKRINKIKYYEPSYVFLDLAKVKLIYYHFSIKRRREGSVLNNIVLCLNLYNNTRYQQG